MTLQERAKAFLKRRIPKDLHYVPGSISEGFVAAVARDGKIALDEELAELLADCAAEAKVDATVGSGACRAYFQESAKILQAILRQARRKRPRKGK
jgi:hypothetical protein